jgi:flagellar basal-body rod protein FlgG
MLQSLYTALSGLRTQQYNIDTIANNVANVNTTGFKSSRADFADTLYALIKRPIESGEYLQNGTGIGIGGTQVITDAGTALSTARNLDFMLDGDGYFTLQGPQGQLYFTRDGSFRASVENNGTYLVSSEGYYVLGADNQRIQIPGDASAIAADGAGGLSIAGATFAALKITRFANPAGLMSAGGNKLSATEASGAATAGAGETTVRQGWLEGSNVDLATELTRLIRAQRVYTALGSALRTADDMDSQANNLA